MNKLAKDILRLSGNIKEVSSNKVKNILKIYSTTPKVWRNISKLRKALRQKNPYLFSADIKVSSPRKTNRKLRRIASLNDLKKGALDMDCTTDNIKNCLRLNKSKIKSINYRLKKIFPTTDFIHSFRVKTTKNYIKELGNKSSHGITDFVGLRVVPRNNWNLLLMLRKFEREFSDIIVFKLNTLMYSNREIKKTLEKSSIYYRAIHYYIETGSFFTEIQIRTQAIDQWSKIHHPTIYKQKFKISSKTRENVIKFGEISNVVDYFMMLNT